MAELKHIEVKKTQSSLGLEGAERDLNPGSLKRRELPFFDCLLLALSILF